MGSCRLWFYFPWFASAGLCGMVALVPIGWHTPETGSFLFLASLALLGMPHGALDLELRRLIRVRGRKVSITVWIAGYLAVAALVVVLWDLAPGFSMGAFLLLTVWHWGSGDCVPVHERAGGWQLVFHAFCRGSWIILAPFVWHLEETAALFTSWGSGQVWLVPPILWMALVVADLIFSIFSSRAGGKRHSAWEVLPLALSAAWLPPLVWLTLYFICFHSWRHILRVLHEGEGKPQWPGVILIWLGGVALLLPVIYFREGTLAINVVEWTGQYLVLLAALTVPHAIHVRLLDYKFTQSGG